MINTQLISFNGLSPSYNSVISTTRSAAEGITEVFTNTQLLSIIAIVTAISSVLFGAYKLAMHLGYFSPGENEDAVASAPPYEEESIVFERVSSTAPPLEEVLPESSPEMQKILFEERYPRFGKPS